MKLSLLRSLENPEGCSSALRAEGSKRFFFREKRTKKASFVGVSDEPTQAFHEQWDRGSASITRGEALNPAATEPAMPSWAPQLPQTRSPAEESLFASFSSEKEALASLLTALRRRATQFRILKATEDWFFFLERRTASFL